MSQSNLEILEPRLVPVDSYYLSVIDERIQDLSNDCESLAYALNTIETNDPASEGVITAIRAALFANGELAADISANMLAGLICKDEIKVNDYE